MAKVSAIILAAGLSRRMGEENKLFLSIKGKPMVEWVIENVSKSIADEVVLVASELSMDQLTKWQSDRIQLVENLEYKQGMTSSIQAGVNAATGDAYMICLSDQPLIKTETYDLLIQTFQEAAIQDPSAIVLPFFKDKKGNPVIFSAQYRTEILNHVAPEGCKEIVQANRKHLRKVDTTDAGILMDIDTQEDYKKMN